MNGDSCRFFFKYLTIVQIGWCSIHQQQSNDYGRYMSLVISHGHINHNREATKKVSWQRLYEWDNLWEIIILQRFFGQFILVACDYLVIHPALQKNNSYSTLPFNMKTWECKIHDRCLDRPPDSRWKDVSKPTRVEVGLFE